MVALVVFPALWEATHRHSRLFLIIKPFMSFMQLQALGVWFYINWPEDVTTLLNGYEAVSLYSEQLFPLDCLFGETPAGNEVSMRLVYKKVLWYLAMPSICAVLACMNWLVVYAWRWWYIRRHPALVGVRSLDVMLLHASSHIYSARRSAARTLCWGLMIVDKSKEPVFQRQRWEMYAGSST